MMMTILRLIMMMQYLTWIGSCTSSRALEDSASMLSVRSIPVDCPSVPRQYERRDSIAADYHRENLPCLSDHGCYNTL